MNEEKYDKWSDTIYHITFLIIKAAIALTITSSILISMYKYILNELVK